MEKWILTKDNVKVGDELYVVPSDTRQHPWHFIVGKIGRSYIVDKNGREKIALNTHEIYHKDGIGCTENVFHNEGEYEKWKRHYKIRHNLALKMRECGQLFFKMTDEDIDTINKIMSKYSKGWATLYED